MKKIISTAFLAVFALGSMTSCNKDVDPIEFTPQYILAFNISDLMRSGLVELFAYEEAISAKIAKGEELPLTVKVITDDLGDTIGWKSGFNINESYFRDSITVMFSGSPLADNSVKTIDCSKLTLQGNSAVLKLFGTFEVTNNSTSATATSRNVETTNFGWGETNNDVYLNASYTFNNTYSSDGLMTSCKISGSASGKHVSYGTFSQDISDENAISSGDYNFFTSGSMTLESAYFPLSSINVSFTSSSIIVTYNGETTTY
ncbi:MAG: hypothetical protein LBP85_10235 [Prevotellaceae bacterium]|nr:hypothetical protein [Prevotellaceae bacterium]